MRKLVTTALIYANGNIHIGHVRSTYLPADVYCRFFRRTGQDLLFVSGSDEYGTPISIQADRLGVSPIDIANKYHEKDIREFRELGISFDYYDRTSNPEHTKTTQEFFTTLLEKDYVYEKTLAMPYCPQDKRFLPDRYVRGICPHCGFEDARGDECDNCGRALAEGEIVKPACYICGTPAILKETTHWFLRLSQFQDWLTDWIQSDEVNLPAIGKQFLIGQYLTPGLYDIAITRDLDWGIPVPLPNTKNKVLYVWFDAPIGYIDSTKEWAKQSGEPDAWKKYWLEPETEIIHFIGKGILYHHSIFWPSLLKGVNWQTPKAIPAYGYGTLEGLKLSKEHGWVVELSEFLERYNPDSLRYYWLTVSPLKEDADFSWDEYGRRHNNELNDTLGNFVHRVLTFTHDRFNAQTPSLDALPLEDSLTLPLLMEKVSPESQAILSAIPETFEKVKESISSFEIRNGILEIMNLARLGNKYFNDRTPWKTIKITPDHAKETILVALQITKALAALLEPYIPFSAEKIWTQLGLQSDIHKESWSKLGELVPQGHKIQKPVPLFVKIAQKTLEKEKQKLKNETEKATQQKRDKPMSTISFDTFKSVQLVVGQIVSAANIEGSKKLLKLQVDLGEPDLRQIVAGLAEIYSPDELTGRKVVVVANLQPAKLFNTMSNGMILAADHEGTIKLLSVDEEMPPGSKIM